MLKKLWLSLLLFVSTTGLAADNENVVETFQFETEAQQMQAIELSRVLRCPTCQNQNLLESNAPIARDMRWQVYQMVAEGQNNQQIIGFMTDRFGDFVYYKPKLGKDTLVLWGLPLVMLVGFALAIFIWSWRQRKHSKRS